MNALELENLRKSFAVKVGNGFVRATKEVLAVQGVSFEVPAGQSLALIGPNGAGKSTVIKMLTGVLRPTRGQARVLGLSPFEDRQKLARRIGSVFGQRSQLWYHLPAKDSFDLLSHIYELGKNDYLKRRDELVERLKLSSFLNTPVRKLSLGQRMRAEIAASLLHKPELLFLDEPSIGLDVVAKQELRKIIAEWHRQEGLTVLLTSHDTADIEAVSERVIVINHGQIVLDDTVDNVRKEHLNSKVVSVVFHSESEVLNLPGLRVLEAESNKHRYELDCRRHSVAELASQLLKQGQVADLSIEDPPLDDLIADIFSRSAQGAPAAKAV